LNFTGEIIPIGSVKQKIHTAEKAGVDVIILPYDKNLTESDEIDIIYVKSLSDAIKQLYSEDNL